MEMVKDPDPGLPIFDAEKKAHWKQIRLQLPLFFEAVVKCFRIFDGVFFFEAGVRFCMFLLNFDGVNGKPHQKISKALIIFR